MDARVRELAASYLCWSFRFVLYPIFVKYYLSNFIRPYGYVVGFDLVVNANATILLGRRGCHIHLYSG